MRVFVVMLLLALPACSVDARGDGEGGHSGAAGAGGVMDAGPGDSAAGASGGAGGVAGTGGAAGAGGIAGGGGSAGAGGVAGGSNDCPRAKVAVSGGNTLNVRPTPSTAQEPVAELNDGDIVDVLAQVQGESVQGTSLWFQIAQPSGYITSAFASCTQELPPAG